MPRGSKPGERRGGRQKGTPNRVTAEVKALAHKGDELSDAEIEQIIHASRATNGTGGRL
jgi:hypothetical protein